MRSITWQLIVQIIELAASWMASLHKKLNTTSAELCHTPRIANRQLEWWIGFWKDTDEKLSPQRPLTCTSRTNLDPKSRIANENAQHLTRYGVENLFHVFHVFESVIRIVVSFSIPAETAWLKEVKEDNNLMSFFTIHTSLQWNISIRIST